MRRTPSSRPENPPECNCFLLQHVLKLRMRFACFTCLIAVLSLATWACSEEAAPPSLEDVRSEIEPTQQSWDVHYVVSEAGGRLDESRPRIEILAHHMATYETKDSTYTVMRSDTTGRRVIAYLYDEEGDTSATVHADRLILHEAERRFEARGDVIVQTTEEKSLESEHLVWLEDDRSVRTPGFVRITTPKERIQGYNLVADEDLDTYSLTRVTGLVEVEEGDEEEGGVMRDGGGRGSMIEDRDSVAAEVDSGEG